MKLKNIILHFVLIACTGICALAQAPEYPPPGELVDNGGYKMHLIIQGKDKPGPNVIFFHGAGDIALNWNLVLPEVGKFATAVAIDQNGEGWSEHGHGASLYQQVYDSYQVLKKANIDPPYILVGHSLGGIIANLFAVEYPNETAGVVMVDATHPDVVLKIFNRDTKEMEWKKLRFMANESIPPVNTELLSSPKEVSSFQAQKDFGDMLDKFSEEDRELFNWIYNVRPWTYVKGQGNAYEAEIFQKMYDNYDQYGFGNRPLIVLTGGNKEVPEGDDNWTGEQLREHSDSLQKEMLTLSSNSRQVMADKSGHHIHIDQPELVVSSIEEMVEEIDAISEK